MTQGKFRKTQNILLALGLATVLSALPHEARACGGAWYPIMEESDVDHRERGVPMAERALDEGRLVAAAGLVIRQMPHVKQLQPKRHKLVERAQRVLALAVVRHDGALPIKYEVPAYAQGTFAGKTAEHRKENLEWAAKVLRQVSEIRHGDPGAQTDLGEALARIDAHRAEARTLLEKLAEKDLVTSPEAYAALARLRAAAGDENGERMAVQRCEKMARDAGMCRAPTHAAS